MLLAGSFLDAWNRFLKHLLADGPHLAEDIFQGAMISDGLLIERRLLGGKSKTCRFGFYFASQSPRMRRLWIDAALSNPAESQKLLFQRLIASFQQKDRGGPKLRISRCTSALPEVSARGGSCPRKVALNYRKRWAKGIRLTKHIPLRHQKFRFASRGAMPPMRKKQNHLSSTGTERRMMR